MSEPDEVTALREAVALTLGIDRFAVADIGAVIDALGIPAETLRGLRDGSLVAVPREPDEIITYAIREAWRNTRVSGVCGMSVEAQWRNEFAREIAAYRAMLAAAQEPPR